MSVVVLMMSDALDASAKGVTFLGGKLPLTASVFAIPALVVCGIGMVLDLRLNPRWSAECRSVEPPRPFEFAAKAGVPCPELNGEIVPDDGGERIGLLFFAGVAGTLWDSV